MNIQQPRWHDNPEMILELGVLKPARPTQRLREDKNDYPAA
jgi:hypothetical protein